ncbi:hypothetical protein ACJIZ3_008343 [Penstemon smallii]|uniref:EamA domain-containing protein n=1 Tax=Penstemon smallii TaxID=265156 RepID=A0ABD3T9W9_9LAMI
MIIYQSMVETCVVLTALFVSEDWNYLKNEMENFEMGIGSYFMILVLIAVAWQVCSIGAVGLIFEASSLFSNVISTLGLPVMPILAAIFFQEKIDVVKVISILLAFGGFGLYVYQHYLEDCEIGRGDGIVKKQAKSSLVENCISNEIAL